MARKASLWRDVAKTLNLYGSGNGVAKGNEKRRQRDGVHSERHHQRNGIASAWQHSAPPCHDVFCHYRGDIVIDDKHHGQHDGKPVPSLW